MRGQNKNRNLRRVIAASAAAAISMASSSMVRADYASVSVYDDQAQDLDWANPVNWNPDGVPTATTLAEVPIIGGFSISLNGDQTIYGLRVTNPNAMSGFVTRINEGTPSSSALTLLSEDAVYDPATNKAPAIFIAPEITGESFQTDADIVLGNTATAGHRAYVVNNAGSTGKSIVFNDNIREFDGSSWGLTFTTTTGSTAQTELKGGNYLSGGYDYSGDTHIESRLRVYNALIPAGPGAGNVFVDGGGEFRLSQNSGTILINGLNSTTTTGTVVSQSGGNRPFAFGANNANGSFAGAIATTGSSSFPVLKIGSGTQALSNSANAWTGPTYLVNGVLSVNHLANGGQTSALGRGVADDTATVGTNETTASLLFDGATLQYTGAGHSTDRLFTLGFRGGTLDASGTGAVNFTSTDPIALSDNAYVILKNNETDSTTATAMSRLGGLAALASTLTAQNLSGTANIPAGSTVASIDEAADTITFSSATVGAPGSGSGYPLVQLMANTPVDRVLTLTGTSTADNTLAAALGGMSGLGGNLGITKTGTGTWLLTGANTYAGPTTVNGGTLAVTAQAIPAGNAISVNSGGNYEMRGENSVFRANNLTVNNGGKATVAVTSNGTSALRSNDFVLSGSGQIDLTNNKLITDDPAGTATGGVYNGVQGLVQSARSGGSWTGPGITSSLIPAVPAGEASTAIGVATGAQVNPALSTPGATALFAGETITGTDTVAMYTYGGDANLDGLVSGDDYTAIDFAIGVAGASGWANGDFNYDGIISGDDYTVIDFNIAAQGAPFATSASGAASGVTAVPEPASLSVIGLAAASLLGRRRRRH